MHPANESEGGLFVKLKSFFDSSRWVGITAGSLIREDSGFKELATKAPKNILL
jgi:hypothetical protein